MDLSNVGPTTAWKILICPTRTNYNMLDLGPQLMSYQNFDSFREDFRFTNKRGKAIMVSVYFPILRSDNDNHTSGHRLNRPCILYCHSQSGCRIEGAFLQEFCIENGLGLCLFDFEGCGKSQGDYVTLGWHEQDDISQLVDLLIGNYNATQIILWGRSMGAVSSIMYAERNSMFLSSMVS